MRSILFAVNCLVFAALPAAALEKELVNQIVQSAQNIGRDATSVNQALKSKKFDAATVTKNIEAMEADIAALHEVVSKFEATNPSLSDRDRADWKLVKDKVQLIEIMHGQKKKLAAEDFSKNRSLVRAHATGLAQRAKRLQATAEKLSRS
jgi:septal ring factor EnvC (AmiA/AmiB activator)